MLKSSFDTNQKQVLNNSQIPTKAKLLFNDTVDINLVSTILKDPKFIAYFNSNVKPYHIIKDITELEILQLGFMQSIDGLPLYEYVEKNKDVNSIHFLSNNEYDLQLYNNYKKPIEISKKPTKNYTQVKFLLEYSNFTINDFLSDNKDNHKVLFSYIQGLHFSLIDYYNSKILESSLYKSLNKDTLQHKLFLEFTKLYKTEIAYCDEFYFNYFIKDNEPFNDYLSLLITEFDTSCKKLKNLSIARKIILDNSSKLPKKEVHTKNLKLKDKYIEYDNIKNYFLHFNNKAILLQAPTGSGKTTLFTQKYVSDIKNINKKAIMIYILPKINLINQKSKTTKKSIAYHSKTNKIKDFSNVNIVYTTPEQLFKLINLLLNREIYLIFDECHLITADSSYRNTFYTLNEYLKNDKIKQVIFTSATIDLDFFNMVFDIGLFINIKQNSSMQPKTIKLLTNNDPKHTNTLQYNFNVVMSKLVDTTEGIHVVYLNNKDDIQAIINNIPSELKSKIDYITADTMDSPVLQSIITNNMIPSNIKVLLTTNVISEGVDLLNDNILSISILVNYISKNPNFIIQALNRVRKNSNTNYELYYNSINLDNKNFGISFKNNFLVDYLNIKNNLNEKISIFNELRNKEPSVESKNQFNLLYNSLIKKDVVLNSSSYDTLLVYNQFNDLTTEFFKEKRVKQHIKDNNLLDLRVNEIKHLATVENDYFNAIASSFYSLMDAFKEYNYNLILDSFTYKSNIKVKKDVKPAQSIPSELLKNVFNVSVDRNSLDNSIATIKNNIDNLIEDPNYSSFKSIFDNIKYEIDTVDNKMELFNIKNTVENYLNKKFTNKSPKTLLNTIILAKNHSIIQLENKKSNITEYILSKDSYTILKSKEYVNLKELDNEMSKEFFTSGYIEYLSYDNDKYKSLHFFITPLKNLIVDIKKLIKSVLGSDIDNNKMYEYLIKSPALANHYKKYKKLVKKLRAELIDTTEIYNKVDNKTKRVYIIA